MSLQTVQGVRILGPPRHGQHRDGVYNQEEIVSLITRYYELLAKMRYFPKSYIKYPPHEPAIDLKLAKELNLEPQVIELLQALPYVEGYSNEDEFILWGSFADMRDPEVLRQSRDPAYTSPSSSEYDDADGQYVRPWELVINECGNHGTIMFLDTRNGHITMEGQDSGGCNDPALRGIQSGPQGINRQSHDHLPSRHAKELFEDFMNRLLKLEWIPSSDDRRMLNYRDSEYYDMKLLFLTYGWPNNFDASGFDDAYVRLREFSKIRDDTVDGAREVLHVLGEMQKAEDALMRHSRRLHNGVWDHSITKSRKEIKRLENEHRKLNKTVEKIRSELEHVKLSHGGWESEEEEIRKIWRRNLKKQLQQAQDDLTYMTGPGSEYSNNEQVSAQEEKIAMITKRLENVNEEPTSVEMAIMPREKKIT
ncbi:hypothetical protein ACMFMG_007406 [Clarireedia jacksonii]